MIFTANVFNPTLDEFPDAVNRLRGLSAELDSLSHSLNAPTRWFVYKRLNLDLVSAGGALRGLAVSLDRVDGEREISRHDVEKALNLPLSDTPARIARKIDRIDGDT